MLFKQLGYAGKSEEIIIITLIDRHLYIANSLYNLNINKSHLIICYFNYYTVITLISSNKELGLVQNSYIDPEVEDRRHRG